MSNQISYDGVERISMSNGLATVVCHVLGLSGSMLATTSTERGIIRYLLADAEPCSRGTGGFDLTDLPWSPESFESDREFLLRVIDDAALGRRWSLLSYQPASEMLIGRLDRLRSMIGAMSQPDSCSPPTAEADETTCSQHALLLVNHVCVLCHYGETLIG